MIEISHLKNEIIQTELHYSLEFSQLEQTDFGLRFTDRQLPDMHCHNFIRIEKESLSEFSEIIQNENQYRKKIHCEAVQIEIFDCHIDDFRKISEKENISEQIVMYCEIDQLHPDPPELKIKTHMAESDPDFQKGKEIDRLTFGEEYAEFSDRRFDRKVINYKDRESSMNHFICYNKEDLLGNCDFFIYNNYGKIEDFDVIERHQRKGYGRAIIQSVREYAISHGVEVLFLQVESDNSAIEMYRKLGFKPMFNNILYNRNVII